MDNEPKKPTQKTAKGKEIPTPKRDDFMRDLKKAVKPSTRESPPKK